MGRQQARVCRRTAGLAYQQILLRPTRPARFLQLSQLSGWTVVKRQMPPSTLYIGSTLHDAHPVATAYRLSRKEHTIRAVIHFDLVNVFRVQREIPVVVLCLYPRGSKKQPASLSPGHFGHPVRTHHVRCMSYFLQHPGFQPNFLHTSHVRRAASTIAGCIFYRLRHRCHLYTPAGKAVTAE